MASFTALLKEVRACVICKADLPLGPRPVLQLHPRARILIAGQAPGRKVHESGVPFDDASGNRLREWMGVTREAFYDPKQIAILPMGFCFPGTGKSGDLMVPLPHPSPRNNMWLSRNPWFEKEVLPALQKCVSKTLK